MAELTAGEKHQLYERLMAAIFGQRRDPRVPFCYPYIFEGEQKVSLEERMKEVLETLTDSPGRFFSAWTKIQWTRENQIQLLNLRFGLEDGRIRAYREIGQEFNVTRARIPQVEAIILRRLRHPSRSGLLRRFLVPTPEEREEELQRFKVLREERERLDKIIQELREEREFIQRFGCLPEQFEEKEIERSREALRDVLQRAASLHPGTTPGLVSRAYNSLVRNGINSLTHLRTIMEVDERKIASLRYLGKKSFWLICETLKIAEEETN